MSDTEKSKPNKESTSAVTTVAPPANTTTKVSSGSSDSTTSSSPNATITTSSTTSTTSVTTTAISTSTDPLTSTLLINNNSNSCSSDSSSNSFCSIVTKVVSPPPLPPPPPPPPPPRKPASPILRPQAKLFQPPAPVNRIKVATLPALRKAFAELMRDPESVDKAADYLFESLLDDAVMGVFIEVHQSVKTGAREAIEGEWEDDKDFEMVDTPNFDVFGSSTARKAMDCTCPNCDRLVAALRFAPHLEKCMGMGRKTSRTASRRLANAKEGNNSNYFQANATDDEDDADWSSEKRRKKIQNSRTNGSKKNSKSA